jgi:hypothetical protein
MRSKNCYDNQKFWFINTNMIDQYKHDQPMQIWLINKNHLIISMIYINNLLQYIAIYQIMYSHIYDPV